MDTTASFSTTNGGDSSRSDVVEIAECDKAGNLKATYIESHPSSSSSATTPSNSRIDVFFPTAGKSLWQKLLVIFLPDGYPQSVTDDYTKYQIYDSLQAFAGSIAGMISSRAVWVGLGVGDASASPTGAMLIQIVRECMGKLATIVFAHSMGTAIEAECKMYRFKADVLCDAAMVLDCLSPLVPVLGMRVAVLCVSSVLYAAAGVAGGAAKSSLSGHFARWNNLGELNAKDGSQETMISLMGNMAGTAAMAFLSTPTATWLSLICLLVVHLVMNWIGVKAVKMRSLNRQRANIVFSNLLDKNKVLDPAEVSQRESIFAKRGGSTLRGKNGTLIGHCDFGVSLQTLISSLSQNGRHGKTGSSRLGPVDLSTLTRLFRHQGYLLWYERQSPRWNDTPSSTTRVLVVLKEEVTTEQQLRAWYHALILARRVLDVTNSKMDASDSHEEQSLSHVGVTLDQVQASFDAHARRLRDVGWNLDIPVLETCTGSRVIFGKTPNKS
ncbi:vitamin B6 photo-protection and homoeostasis-domain-containing protein [Pseudomassariella vexata]|uniref:Vitamin B6 photo-protection and homoeostasis-domain-containing protein n=1 Tax=Pseudomassariella vexata TaxID=1141098 RepID=A0A1Y2DXG7_9PEZI|nr:vitamin B6 photo-protection and homoeostasis-domain-containing protein [Pseudomassariella vexata]ORY63315.1 vitamin B6 photo-protection and homoeostasis-domain-containing protein [Pseudomassariella vexata]